MLYFLWALKRGKLVVAHARDKEGGWLAEQNKGPVHFSIDHHLYLPLLSVSCIRSKYIYICIHRHSEVLLEGVSWKEK